MDHIVGLSNKQAKEVMTTSLYKRSATQLFIAPLMVLGFSIAVVAAGAEVLHAAATDGADLQPVVSVTQQHGVQIALGQ